MSFNTPPEGVYFRASNREHMQRWVKALESGAYKQGEGELRHVTVHDGKVASTTYCCLGVACEVAKLNGVVIENALSTIDGEPTNGYSIPETPEQAGSRENGHLPLVVRKWLGIGSSNPTIGFRPSDHTGVTKALPLSASNANDSYNWDFAQIAKWLRYVYMIGWTDDQVRAAVQWNREHGETVSASKIEEMLGEPPSVDYSTLPAAPSFDEVTKRQVNR